MEENVNNYKKEDLGDKINEIKIYLKSQFEKGSDKKDFEFIESSEHKNKEIFNRSNLSNHQTDILNQRKEMCKEKTNYFLYRSNSNCQGIIIN